MKNKMRLLIALTLVLCTLLMNGCNQKETLQQWEYKIIEFSHNEIPKTIETRLETLGNDGWEYAGPVKEIQAGNFGCGYFIAFKRPK